MKKGFILREPLYEKKKKALRQGSRFAWVQLTYLKFSFFSQLSGAAKCSHGHLLCKGSSSLCMQPSAWHDPPPPCCESNTAQPCKEPCDAPAIEKAEGLTPKLSYLPFLTPSSLPRDQRLVDVRGRGQALFLVGSWFTQV